MQKYSGNAILTLIGASAKRHKNKLPTWKKDDFHRTICLISPGVNAALLCQVFIPGFTLKNPCLWFNLKMRLLNVSKSPDPSLLFWTTHWIRHDVLVWKQKLFGEHLKIRQPAENGTKGLRFPLEVDFLVSSLPSLFLLCPPPKPLLCVCVGYLNNCWPSYEPPAEEIIIRMQIQIFAAFISLRFPPPFHPFTR